MRAAEKRKVTVSLAADVVAFADLRAARLHTTRSQVIEEALRATHEQERDELAREGYRFFSREAEDYAAATLRLAHEVLEDDRQAR